MIGRLRDHRHTVRRRPSQSDSFAPAAIVVLLFAAILMPFAKRLSAGEPSPEDLQFFESRIRPLLVEHCYQCHSGESKRLQAGLYLDRASGLTTGGDSGPAIVPGEPDESLLIEAVRYESYEMPPKGKLSDQEIELLAEWVRRGAPWPDEPEPTAPIAEDPHAFDLVARKQSHPAWRPLERPAPPEVSHTDWPTTDADRFILEKLEGQGLIPAEAADRRTLVRRLYLDLIGLPPKPEEVERFVRDDSPDAYERLVDELLASPHFGERWGRHWLDLVRYAESRGHEFDHDAPNAFQYRDYVIRALNADVPYDEFVAEHIAGDLVRPPRLNPTEGFNESILGTGFWYLGEWVHSPVDVRKDETDRFDNMLDVMSKSFLGLTVACARCHDHKFDAISTRDYYSLSGFLQSSAYRQVRFESMEHNRAVAEELESLRRRMQPQLREAAAAAFDQGIANVDKYLLAAREVLFAPVVAEGETADLADVAASYHLDVARLEHWVDAIQEAEKDVASPLAGWLRECDESFGLPTGEELKSIAVVEAEVDAKSEVDRDPSSRTVIDFETSTDDNFFQDGYSFGQSPVARGELCVSGTPRDPQLFVARYAAASRDPIWNGLVVDTHVVTNQKNRLNEFPRPGRTLSTPTFELATGKVSYLIRGGCYAVACVDSHRLVYGPLHGETVLEIKPDGSDEPRWVTQELTRYVGHRLSLEFTTREDDPLDVLLVVDGLPPAGEFASRGERAAPETSSKVAFVALSEIAADTSAEGLAARYERRMNDAVALWRSGNQSRNAMGSQDAALVDWMLEHLDLFASADAPSRKRLARLARSYLHERSALAERIQLHSHTAIAMLDLNGEDDRVLIRGSSANPGETVPRRFLEAIAGPEPMRPPHGSGRLELAAAINDPDNPFTSRVIVNRLWHHLFGCGIVPTVDDFGVLGQPATHPELLDHLATWFLDHDRSLKTMIKYMVFSSTYRMSSRPDAEASQVDPKNLLWQHMPVKRLEGEVLRDALLAISGRLDSTMFGESVPIHLTDFMDGRGRPKDSGPLDGDGRRSIYVAVRRNFLSPFMLAFDTPSPFSTMGRRNVSNVPAQALILMNDPLVVEQARLWAERALARDPDDAARRITRMYETVFARPPRDDELAMALAFVEAQAAVRDMSRDDVSIWADLAHTLINVKEFVFVR